MNKEVAKQKNFRTYIFNNLNSDFINNFITL